MANQFDSSNYATSEPESFVVGDYLAWKRTDLHTDYSNTLYTLKYSARLEGTGTTEIEITAAASGTEYLIEEASATTAAYTPGVYHWQAYITRISDSERIQIGSGTFEALPNRDLSTADPRTHAKIVLDAIEATIAGRASQDQMSYSIAGRSLSRMPIDDLLKFRNEYKAEVAREERKQRLKDGKGASNNIFVRFT